MPHISVITPASRGVPHLTQLLRDFKNQTFQDFEHIICWDGQVPGEVMDFMKVHEKDYNIRFVSVAKDLVKLAKYPKSPGTGPRIHGTSLAKGDFVYYADDDNRYKDTLLESLINGMNEKRISVVQVACAESRIKRNGDTKRITFIPEVGLPTFPMVCHVDTACFMVPRKWALKDPWGYEGNTHDYSFLKRIIEKNKPEILMKNGVQVDLDGLFVKGLKDWVTLPPFYRG